MPRPLFWLYLPQHLLVNVLTTLAYALKGQGRAALLGKRDALRDLGRVLAERRRIQDSRVATSREIRRAMKRGAAVYALPFVIRTRERSRKHRLALEHV